MYHEVKVTFTHGLGCRLPGCGGAKLGAAADPDRCLDCNFRAGRDDGSDPKAAAALYEKLITEDKVDAVIGPYGSAMTDAAADVTEKHRKLTK